jgi:ABC-2 type transport system permease protein
MRSSTAWSRVREERATSSPPPAGSELRVPGGSGTLVTLALTCAFPDHRASKEPPIATNARTIERTSEPPRLRVGARLRELWSFREVLFNLVRKELKVKYTGSVLGAVWSLLNPLVFLAVFYFVGQILGAAATNYPVFLLAGLLPWNLFSASLSQGAVSVIMNANLVKKVYFPREILPLATIGVALVDFVLQSLVFFTVLIIFGYGFALDTIWLYPLAFAGLLVFTTAMAFWVSSVNVRYRDVTHLIGLALLVWFWLTPIVYAAGVVHSKLLEKFGHGELLWRIYLLNPMTWIVSGFQTALYHSFNDHPVLIPISTGNLGASLVVLLVLATVLLYGTWRVFFGMSGDFAEEL